MRNVLGIDTVKGDRGPKLVADSSKEKGLGKQNHHEVEMNVS